MIKQLFALIVIIQCSIVLSAPIQMPSESVLQNKLNSIGMGFFAEKTDFIKQLANQEIEPLAVNLAFELSIGDYLEKIKKDMPGLVFKRMQDYIMATKPKILEKLLEEYPSALKELKG